MDKNKIINNVRKHEKEIYEAERWLWKHPETGYKEYETNEYLKKKFIELGYDLICPKDITGFYTDIKISDGPTICIIGELDALNIANHPESVNGNCHSCGHHAQGATLLAIAKALKEEGSLDDLKGTIRLMLVPAEEMIELEYRENLRQKGIIKYFGGKIEFMSRGYFDDVDIAFMVHTTTKSDIVFSSNKGNNGCLSKVVKYIGKSSHAGGSPDKRINAQYAAMLGLEACNSLRETFIDEDHIRFHPIMKGVSSAVNIIPDEMVIETFVRGSDIEAIFKENKKLNRALVSGALGLGANIRISDRAGYGPVIHDEKLFKLIEEVCIDLVGKENVNFDYEEWSKGSSDFGDLTCVMPGVQFFANGAIGSGHGTNYYIDNPYNACINSAIAQIMVLHALLEDDYKKAIEIKENYKPRFSSIKEYLAFLDEIYLEKECIKYLDDGNILIELN